MRISATGNLIVETALQDVHVLRFLRPDLREYLWDDADAPMSPLFREIQATALSDLVDGSVLIVNLGLVDLITAAFYRCLLGIRADVRARHGQLVLCGLSPLHREIFTLLRGPEVFTSARTEVEALRVARAWLINPQTPRRVRLSDAVPDQPVRVSRTARHAYT